MSLLELNAWDVQYLRQWTQRFLAVIIPAVTNFLENSCEKFSALPFVVRVLPFLNRCHSISPVYAFLFCLVICLGKNLFATISFAYKLR